MKHKTLLELLGFIYYWCYVHWTDVDEWFTLVMRAVRARTRDLQFLDDLDSYESHIRIFWLLNNIRKDEGDCDVKLTNFIGGPHPCLIITVTPEKRKGYEFEVTGSYCGGACTHRE